jgi:ribosomal-protein-alanine N-acetyltransferase
MCAAPTRKFSGRGRQNVCPDKDDYNAREAIVIPAGYTIRPALADEAGNSAQIFLEAPEAAPWSERATWEILESPRIVAFVAYPTVAREAADQQIVAFAAGRIVVGEAEVLNVAVLKSHRQIGLGWALVAHLLAEFERETVTRVFLEVRESNQAAAELYRGMGFSTAGRRPGYYQNPSEAALILEKLIGVSGKNRK